MIRDWQPGDGLTCRFSKRSPIPCDRPTKADVSTHSDVKRGQVTRVQPLCERHAASRGKPDKLPGAIRAAAKKAATEEVIAAHWDEYESAIERHMARLEAPANQGA